MSQTKYLEFDSTYRNRSEDPFPSSFVAGISQSGQLPKTYSVDPVCNGTAQLVFREGFIYRSLTTAISKGNTGYIEVLKSNQEYLFIRYVHAINNVYLYPKDNFYNGSILCITVAGVLIRRRIKKYIYIGSSLNITNAILILHSSLPDGIIASDGYIENPSTDPITSFSNPDIFIPFGVDIDNYYVNLYFTYFKIEQNAVVEETIKIIKYNGTTHLATLESTPTINWLEVDGAVGEASFCIVRKELPNYYQAIYLYVPPVSTNRLTDFTLNNEPFGRNGPSPPSSIVGFYNNSYNLWYYSPGYYYIEPLVANRILEYTPDVETFINNFPVSVRGNINTNIDALEIVYYSYDNYNPFAFDGSLIQLGVISDYEIELINLIVPNSLISNGYGGIVSKYPYLYVELEQVSEKGNIKNILYSNNPNSSKALFRAIVDDTTQPLYSPFIKMDGDGMVHKIKFKPVDYFRLSVYFSNGELFKTVEQDTYSPYIPNPLVQISACFAIRKCN